MYGAKITYLRRPEPEQLLQTAGEFAVVNAPENDEYIRDRVEQSLAELSLEDVDGQFPIDIVTVEQPETKRPITVRNSAIRQVRKNLDVFPLDLQIPTMRIDPSYFVPKEGTPVSAIPSFQDGPMQKLLDVVETLSEGTAQGTVYKIAIHPNPSLVNVSVIDRFLGSRDNVMAVMKKSPIYRSYLWLQYVALQNVANAYRTYGGREGVLQNYPDLVNQLATGLMYAKVDPQQVFATNRRQLEQYAENIDSMLRESYDDPENESYIDVIGYFFGSTLTEYGITPFFPLLYGTFRVRDQNYFSEEVIDRLGPTVNEDFPVQIVIMQALNGDIFDLVKDGFFFNLPGAPTTGLNSEKILSVFAQVVFGLSAAQHYFGLVHNDFHNGNLMYEDASADHYLYYANAETGEYWKVPTFGKIYKMIDFGRASFDYDGNRFASQEQNLAVGGNWGLYDKNNDLLRFASIFADDIDLYRYVEDPNTLRDPTLLPIVEMVGSIINCNGGDNPIAWENQCRRGIPQEVRREIERIYGTFSIENCRQYMFSIRPYENESPCHGAIPKENLHWFDRFRIDREEIPEDAIIHQVYS
jgi:serine/threonine protein kinase